MSGWGAGKVGREGRRSGATVEVSAIDELLFGCSGVVSASTPRWGPQPPKGMHPFGYGRPQDGGLTKFL